LEFPVSRLIEAIIYSNDHAVDIEGDEGVVVTAPDDPGSGGTVVVVKLTRCDRNPR
jgi:hypothetical protein